MSLVPNLSGTQRRVSWFVITLLATVAPVGADEAAVEARLSALESRLAALESENTRLKIQLGEVSAAEATRASLPTAADKNGRSLRFSGYTQIHAGLGGSPDERWNGTEDRIWIRRADIAVRGNLGHDFSFKLESELSSGSLGQRSGHTPRLTDAYINWAASEDISVRIGQFKSPYGRAQLGPNTRLPLVERPLASDRLTVGRQVGVALMGQLDQSIPLNFSLGVFNGTGSNTSFTRNSQFMTAGRVVAGLWNDGDSSAEIAFNGFHYAPKVAGTPGRVAWGVDGAVTFGQFTTEAEYLKSEYDNAAAPDRDADGWWIATIWTPNPVWQGVMRYGSYDPNNGVSDDDSRLWTFGVNYRISGDDLKLSLNYLIGEDPDGHGDRLLSRLQVKF